MVMADLTVIILTYNEERHIARAINCINGLASDVVVVDSFSTDSTVEIARSLRARVLQNRFINYSKQFQWAVDNAPIFTNWVMRLDADEVLESDLVVRIQEQLSTLPPDVVGIKLKRKHVFMGRWIRHGGRYPLVLLRIWRHGYGRIEDRWMDEHMFTWGGRTVGFEGSFADHTLQDLTFFTDKHNKYATREAIEILGQRRGLFPKDKVDLKSTSLTTSIKRLAKENVYNRMPFQLTVSIYFFYRYFIQLGFLDGKEGLIYHFLQGFWYRFLVGVKVLELEKATANLSDADEIKAKLCHLTGLAIE
jgi:glycosyltransferase involved in cell wall biosynthesis